MKNGQNERYFKGRGAQVNTPNKFQKLAYSADFVEGIDEPLLAHSATEYIAQYPKKIISENTSPDLAFLHYVNPYQGCEHGCIYCYARNSHEYWGYSAGLDFERKILVKHNAAQLLEKQFRTNGYQVKTLVLSGNTDCYQPIERKYKITRSLLEVFLKYKHPVAIISKNTLMLRDIDLLAELAQHNLLQVVITINSLREEVRHKMEPRTTTAQARLQLIEALTKRGIPVKLMCAPIVPGINSDEMPRIIEAAAGAGAYHANYTSS